MKTAKELVVDNNVIYGSELSDCPVCKSPLSKCNYRSGRKVVQTLDEVFRVSYQPYRCLNPQCTNYNTTIRSARWLQLAPLHCTYGFDVIAQIGWLRQTARMPFFEIHAQLQSQVQLSESQVRYLYQDAYLPLLACHERLAMGQLEEVANKSGLLLTLDGLAPEGGEPQLWLVRELQTGLTLRCGWLSSQTQIAFQNFLQPIADLKLPVLAVLSDKQQGLPQAIAEVFKNTPHAFCQSHYFKNIAEPIAEIDQGLKVTMRKTIRKQVGALIRHEQVESPGVLTVTGLIPSAIEEGEAPISLDIQVETGTSSEVFSAGQSSTQNEAYTYCQSKVESCSQQNRVLGRNENNEPSNINTVYATDMQSEVNTEIELQVSTQEGQESEIKTDVQAGTMVSILEPDQQINQERDQIILDLTRRVRYLLTLKGRPPFRLAGLEMFERLNEVVESIEVMIRHESDTRLVELCAGIKQGLSEVADQMQELSIAANWLSEISHLLDLEGREPRTASQVRQELFDYLSDIRTDNKSQILDQIAKGVEKTTINYEAGLFVSYDIVSLPRTNNERESEFRLLNSRLLRTTGQIGATKRLIQRIGAWELITRPSSFNETVAGLSQVDYISYQKERTRLRVHRARFRLHTRSVKQSRKQLLALAERWLNT